MAIAVVCALLIVGNLFFGSAVRDLASIQYRFTPCGAVGRNGPSISQCTTWYRHQNSPITNDDRLFGFTLDNTDIYKGSQGFRVPKSGLYNITVAGAAGGRGICSTDQGKGLLWRGVVKLLKTQDLLVAVGQKGVEPCEVVKSIPFCDDRPKNFNESIECFENWKSWLKSHPKLSQEAASTTLNYGGGGGGGGASMLRVRDHRTGEFSRLPIVVVGGGGGSAADISLPISIFLNITLTYISVNDSYEDIYESFINAKSVDRDISLADVHNFTGIRGYIASEVNVFNNRAGVGGGYFPAQSLQQDGSQLNMSENFAIGGLDCLHLSTDLSQRPLLETVHGGFGSGGGQCESGGSGGGYAGGSIFSNRYFGIPGNGGFYDYFSQQNNEVLESNVELNPELNGFIEIVPTECGCGYKCSIDEDLRLFECICPNNTTLAPNKFDCFEGLTIDIREKGEIIDGFMVTYIPFSGFINIFSVYSSVSLNTSVFDFRTNTSVPAAPFCALVFIDETGNVVLKSNTVRIQNGEINKLSMIDVVEPHFKFSLDDPHFVAGAILVSNCICTFDNSFMELSVSVNSFDVELLFNVSMNMDNVLEVARSIQDEDGNNTRLPKITTNSNNNGRYIMIVSVSAVGAVLIILVITLSTGVTCYCFHARKKTKLATVPVENVYTSRIPDNSMVTNLLYHGHTPNVSLGTSQSKEFSDSISFFTPQFGINVPDHNFSNYRRNSAVMWEYSRSKLIYMKELGEGQFGKVLLMKAHGIADYSGKLPVAVKTLSSTDPTIVKKFTEEANLMTTFSHPNIISLLGVSFEDADEDNAPLMILEYMPYGDLNNFLRKYRPDEIEVHPQESKIKLFHFYSFARDVADGLGFLSSKRYIHGDIASRNCLVGPALNIKIADFGLSRELKHGADSYKMDAGAVLPLRWLSPESLIFGNFSVASDVWSYGVLLWEIVTYGEVPLRDVSNEEIIDMAEKRMLRHVRPSNCPDIMYSIMMECHQQSPQSRIRIEEIQDMLLKENTDHLCQDFGENSVSNM